MALLGLADNFLKASPNHPGFKINPAGVLPAIKCLGAIFRLNPRPPPVIEVRTHLQLGSLLLRETQNVDLAKQHLEQAVNIQKLFNANFKTIAFFKQWFQSQAGHQLEDIRFEAGCHLAEIYADTGQLVQAKQVLQEAIKASQRLPYWHCRHLFQLAVSQLS